jgi:predicted nucleic acid-binding protein
MATVYIETTIPSFYFETRTSARAVAWREATRRWWSRHRSRYDLVTSAYVINELTAAPAAKSVQSLALLSGIRVIDTSPRIASIVSQYIRQKVMPGDAVGDAAHLAAASVHGIDFLLTWNCRHLANANKVGHIRAVNERLGLSVPVLTTPLNLEPGAEL